MMRIPVKKQLTLSTILLLLAGLLSAGIAWKNSQQSLVPEVKAQTPDASVLDRIRTRTCSNGLAEGRYAYTFSGSVVGLGSTTAVGVLTVKADGTLQFNDTQSLNGQITRRTFTGTYNLNADCTGTAAFSTGLNGDFVLDDQGKEIRVIITTPGTVISGQGRRIF